MRLKERSKLINYGKEVEDESDNDDSSSDGEESSEESGNDDDGEANDDDVEENIAEGGTNNSREPKWLRLDTDRNKYIKKFGKKLQEDKEVDGRKISDHLKYGISTFKAPDPVTMTTIDIINGTHLNPSHFYCSTIKIVLWNPEAISRGKV